MSQPQPSTSQSVSSLPQPSAYLDLILPTPFPRLSHQQHSSPSSQLNHPDLSPTSAASRQAARVRRLSGAQVVLDSEPDSDSSRDSQVAKRLVTYHPRRRSKGSFSSSNGSRMKVAGSPRGEWPGMGGLQCEIASATQSRLLCSSRAVLEPIILTSTDGSSLASIQL